MSSGAVGAAATQGEEVFVEVEAEVGCGASTAECALWVVDALVSEVRPSELQPLDKEREEKKERASQQQLLPSLVCVCVCVCVSCTLSPSLWMVASAFHLSLRHASRAH